MYKFLIVAFVSISCSSNETGTAQVKNTSEDPTLFTKTLLEFTRKNDFPGFRSFAISKGYRVTDSTKVRNGENDGVDWVSVDTATNNSLICFLDYTGLAILDFVTYDELFSKAMKDHLKTLSFKYSNKKGPKGEDMELFEDDKNMVVEIENHQTKEGKKSIFSFMQFE